MCMHYAYLKSFIPFLDCSFVVTRMGFEKVHILFGKFVFASETPHRRISELPGKDIANAEHQSFNSVTPTRAGLARSA
jgi:hypothetical protein